MGNALLFYLPTKHFQANFVGNCFLAVSAAAAITSLSIAIIAALTFASGSLSLLILGLCFVQILFYFCSAILQSIYNPTAQLFAVIAQGTIQFASLIMLFQILGNNFEFAITALSLGFLAGVLIMMPVIYHEFPFFNQSISAHRFKSDLREIISYGGPMSIWMLAILIIATGDRFVIGFLEIAGGDGYLSMKDLLLGVSGLISMPLLMLMHPLIFSRFRTEGFPSHLVNRAVSLLIILFCLFWTAWQIVGISLFESLSRKSMTLSIEIVFLIFYANLMGCIAIYLQKRLEVHRRTIRLAMIAVSVACFSVCSSVLLGHLYGLYGIASSYLISQTLYCIIIWSTVQKKLNIIHIFIWPTVQGILYWLVGVACWFALEFWISDLSQLTRQILWVFIFGIISIQVSRHGITNLLKRY